MRRTLLAGGAALILAAAAFTTSVTSASAQNRGGDPAGHVGGTPGRGAAPAFRGGNSAPRGGMNNAGPRAGVTGNAYRGGIAPGQSRNFTQGGQRHVGRTRVARGHHRGAPFVGFGAPYHAYGYAYDDDCYQTQRVWTRNGWKYVRVDVCDE
ncbi:MAG: hypothetical protein QOG83_2127 [Alphaproteobacteria bacterium]|jgi:hypothetical protein|nr:hypothetical protein [Alphaproteobacteria bacterium]